MLFKDRERCAYSNPQLIETICQIKFPAILSIGVNEPADFQEQIRDTFPRYTKLQEQGVPKMVGAGTPNARFETPKPTANHQFLSLDNKWRVNLTTGFLALSTLGYTGWEEFAGRLDKVIAAFISVYKPACFERIGLRYINAFSRARLDLEDCHWTELINPAYVSILKDNGIEEEELVGSTLDFSVKTAGAVVKMRAALGDFKQPGAEKEKRFIIDQDVSMSGNLDLYYTAGTLSSLHLTAWRAFSGAITDKLHEAMGPEEV